VLYPLSYGRSVCQCSRVTENRPARPFLDLWARARRSVRVVAEALAEHGIGDNELAALLHLAEAPKGMTISELAGEMGAAFMSVSDAVARLERDGDAERLPHPTDGRASVVRLTKRGRKRARDAERVLSNLTDP
jgi:MarR family transcriptional regulator, multiple antibiotic resistance protein MarR